MHGNTKRLTAKDVALMGEKERLQGLLLDTANGHLYREWYARQLVVDGFTSLYDWTVSWFRSEIKELKKENASLKKQLDMAASASRSENNESESRSNSGVRAEDPFVMATRMIEAGWRCEGMRDPKGALAWILLAKKKRTTWADVDRETEVVTKVERFWAAALHYFELWEVAQEVEDLS